MVRTLRTSRQERFFWWGFVFAHFSASRRLGASEEFWGLGTGGEGLLRPAGSFGSPGLGLLERQVDWHPPGVGRFVSGLWIGNGGPAASFGSSGVLLLVWIWFFESFGAPQRVGASEQLSGLGDGGEGLPRPIALFELEGRGDWPPPRVGRLVLGVWVRSGSPAAS